MYNPDTTVNTRGEVFCKTTNNEGEPKFYPTGVAVVVDTALKNAMNAAAAAEAAVKDARSAEENNGK